MGAILSYFRREDDDTNVSDSVSRPKNRVQAPAIKILIQVPGVTRENVQEWLYVARLISPNDDIYDTICQYIGNSQCHGFGIKVLNIVRVVRNHQQRLGRSDPSLQQKTRMLLWHGTKVASIPFILEHGFKPPAAKGQMFGSGIYFADRASKSARYCLPDGIRDGKPGEIGYMFLCDVLLGNIYNAMKPHNDYTTAPTYTDSRGKQRTCDSVKCTGENIPDRKESKTIYGNLIIPYGRTIKNTRFDNYTVQYNEFIVYKEDRCQPEYLVQFEFTKNVVQY